MELAGICGICGKGSRTLYTCWRCGAIVCPACYDSETNMCIRCSPKRGAEKWKKF